MPGISSRGYILPAILVLSIGLIAVSLSFVQLLTLQARHARLFNDEIRLELLGTSGVARACWLMRYEPTHYQVEINDQQPLAAKMDFLSHAAVYKESLKEGEFYIGKVAGKSEMYVLAELSSDSGRHARRWYHCFFVPDSDQVRNVAIN